MTTYYKKYNMAINVNQVYKTTLSILNKEQRGYLTPYEFNNIARQVQLEMLDKLFYDYNKFLNIENVNRINEGFADIPGKIQEQIDEFYATHTLSELNGNLFALPSNVYQILDLVSGNTKIEKIDKNRLPYLNSSPLTAPSVNFPVYYQTDNSLVVNPQTIKNLVLQYIKMPQEPRFGYVINNSYGVEVYDPNPFIDGGIILGTLSTQTITQNATVISSTTYNITVGQNGTTTSGSGTGASIRVIVSGNAITSLSVTSAGSGFSIGDTISISQSDIATTNGSNIVISLRAADLYSSSTQGSTDFTLHKSQETELIVAILAYAGFVVKNAEVLQGAIQLGQGNAIAKQNQ